MPVEITVPRLGWSMVEGTFLGWLKQEGETVRPGEPLFTLEGEKATQDIEAADPGILRLPPGAPHPGDLVQVGQVIGLLLAPNEGHPTPATAPDASPTASAAAPPPAAAPTGPLPAPATPAPPAAPAGTRSTPASPRARRRAAELGVDLAGLDGGGTSGRITEADVLRAARRPPAAAPAPATPGAPAAPAAPVVTSTMRRLIAQRTAASFATIPHFYLRAEADATNLVRLREDLLPALEEATGLRVTLGDLLLRAQALALRDCPAANCVWADDALQPLAGLDVGLVVGLPDGLVIPVMRAAGAADLPSLVRQRAALVAAARAGRLEAGQMLGGATSLSNLGHSAVDEFAAVIAPGQSSMLAVGRARPRPFAYEGRLALRTTLKLCLSVDHRVLDGTPAAEFLGRIVERIENPVELA